MNTPSPIRCMFGAAWLAPVSAAPHCAEDDQVQVLRQACLHFQPRPKRYCRTPGHTLLRACPGANLRPAAKRPSYFLNPWRQACWRRRPGSPTPPSACDFRSGREDPLYRLAGASRYPALVEIDCGPALLTITSPPVDGVLPGDRPGKTDATDLLASQPWLNITNWDAWPDVDCGADLGRALAPADQPQIQRNRGHIEAAAVGSSNGAQRKACWPTLDNIAWARLNGHAGYLTQRS